MERGDRTAIATFFADGALTVGRNVSLGEGEAHHARVRRLGVGDRVRLVNGAGSIGHGVLIRIVRGHASVELERVTSIEAPTPVHLMLPVGDRERMLMLAEKAVELSVASWRPTVWKRSRSVSPRGEGVAFQGKLRARMIAALTQSGGAWLPEHHPDAPLDRAIAAAPHGVRLLLEASGTRFPLALADGPITVAVGPEGGIEPAEREALVAAGFTPVALASTTLRFETAAIVALGLARTILALEATPHG